MYLFCLEINVFEFFYCVSIFLRVEYFKIIRIYNGENYSLLLIYL